MKNVIPLTPNITLITNGRVLDKTTGTILPISDVRIQKEIRDYYTRNYQVISNISDKVENVVSLERKKIDFYYKNSDGKVDFNGGFLIEVYESGSDGKLNRLFYEEIQDPLDANKSSNDSFSKYFTLEIDGE